MTYKSIPTTHYSKDCIDHGKTVKGFGYSTTRVKVNGISKSVPTHRLIYCEHNDVSLESIKGKVVRHYCDNPRCINPKHLLIGTVQDNVTDMMQRNRCRKAKMYKRTDIVSLYQYQYIQRNYVSHSRTYNAKYFADTLNLQIEVVRWVIMTIKHPHKQEFRINFKLNSNID